MATIKVPFIDDAGDVLREFPQGVTIHEYPELGTLRVASTGEGSDSLLGPKTVYRVDTPATSELPKFDTLDSAELWVDVYFAVGGFTEEDTGERGVPPEVAIADREVLAAYLMTHADTDIDQLAEFFDVSKNTIYSYLSRARARGEEARNQIEE